MSTTNQQKTDLLKAATETIIENAFNTDSDNSDEDTDNREEPAANTDQEKNTEYAGCIKGKTTRVYNI